MDTNRNTANNYQINTFVKGMNSDTSYDMVGADQYLFGQNIRITNNTLIYGEQGVKNTEGQITPVPTGEYKQTDILASKILACVSLKDLGAIITYQNKSWTVWKVKPNEGHGLEFESWFTHYVNKEPDPFSVVLHKETDKVVNLYIADGVHPIVQMNMIGDKPVGNIDYLISNRLMPTDRFVLEKTTGRLKTQQLQYTYRLYKKYGTTTRLAPLTNKFQVIDSNRNKEQGNAEDTRTSVGFKLKLNRTKEWKVYYDHIQVYRVSYIKPNESPKVYLIYDDKLYDNTIEIVDKGDDELQELSVDEFSSLNSQIIIPKSIEQNQGYLFAGNIEDETTFYVDENASNWSAGPFKFDISLTGDTTVSGNLKTYFEQHGIYGIQNVSYNDIFGSSLLRSLRRNDKYRYGIVYYNKYGARSNVVKIKDINTNRYPQFSKSFDYNNGELVAHPVGVEIVVRIPQNKDIVGYQIVRCEKTDQYTHNVLQAALSRPLKQTHDGKDTPYYPNIYLTTQFTQVSYGILGIANNINNYNIYQTFAPEINIQRKDTLSILKGSSINITPLRYVYENIPLVDFGKHTQSLDVERKKILYMCSTTDDESDFSNGTLLQITEEADAEFTITTLGNYYIYVLIPQSISLVQQNPGTVEHRTTNASFTSVFTHHNTIETDNVVYNIWRSNAQYLIADPATSTGDILRVHLYFNNATGSGGTINFLDTGFFIQRREDESYSKSNKSGFGAVINLYSQYNYSSAEEIAIQNIEDVKNPGWDQGFSNVQLGGSSNDLVVSAIKQYKSFKTTIGPHSYVNWAANGMYDLRTVGSEVQSFHIQIGDDDDLYVFYGTNESRIMGEARGWIGPGPVCLLMYAKDVDDYSKLRKQQLSSNSGIERNTLGSIIVNVSHQELQYNDKYTPYYGFGNYFDASVTNPIVFDGDIYITPAEFVNLFKTYDFNQKATTLISGQMVYYIPLESRINTFFDYGMNYRNTSSTNLMLEPGEITGIASQGRPLHQYNMIYSDNNTSIDVFVPQTVEDQDVTNNFPHRICYSQLKTDGENIDNWQIFKPADFIDVDSRYGGITNLLTSDNTLYYWQNKAFGKLSVNERSLVKDENSNSIQLGTGGVLNRYDYLSTRYGMRENDRSSIAAEHGVYWIDVDNTAIPAFTGNGVVNFSEMCNVQNIVNENCWNDIQPKIHYDLQNYELLCKIEDNFELVFNLKLQCCSSIYTRKYKDCIDVGNILYGLDIQDANKMCFSKFNYLYTYDSKQYLPIKFSFAVNPQASLTKVYDNQKLVFTHTIDNLDNISWNFSTDYKTVDGMVEAHSDRENNIWYPIPRCNGSSFRDGFGGRLRGKWLKTDITINDPVEFALSHIITKFRQSYN